MTDSTNKRVADDEDQLLLPETIASSGVSATISEEAGGTPKKRTKTAIEENSSGDAAADVDEEAAEDEYEVEKILKHRFKKNVSARTFSILMYGVSNLTKTTYGMARPQVGFVELYIVRTFQIISENGMVGGKIPTDFVFSA